MSRVFVLGCNEGQVPYLEAARACGFRPIGIDRNPNAPGRGLCDRFHAIGYHDLSAIRALVVEEGLGPDDRVFTAASHHAYEGAAEAAAAAGIAFPEVEAVRDCLDKSRFYARLGALGVPVPPTREVEPGHRPALDPARVYYLKSDYGKSPRYCERIEGGRWPRLPERFDPFYRRVFLLQDEVVGRHFRLNLYGRELAVFARRGEAHWESRPDLGQAHAEVQGMLERIVAALGVDGLLTKFDLIERDGCWYVLDIGLDRPLRLWLLARHLGIDFPARYVRAHLSGDLGMLPRWRELHRPVRISLSSGGGYRVAPVPAAA